jgi:diguanylate cyclase (GGDEF)-like protein
LKPVNATKDFLTNCYTREAFLPFLKKMEEEYLTNKRPFSLLMMDVDHFKSFNDKYGHMLGDEVLKYFSSSLRLDLEDEENVPFRFGGDEFVMVFPNKTANAAYQLAGRLRKNIRTRSCLIKGRQISVTFSGGVAGYPEDANTVEDAMEKADKALYYSKNHGRGRIMKYSDLAQKELLQVILIVVILAVVGGLFYFYRDGLAPLAARWTAAAGSLFVRKETPIVRMAPVEDPDLVPAEAQPVPVPQEPPQQQAPVISEIHLDSGRVVRGVIQHEDDEVVEVEVGLQEGKGILQIKRSQVLRIRRGVKSAP